MGPLPKKGEAEEEEKEGSALREAKEDREEKLTDNAQKREMEMEDVLPLNGLYVSSLNKRDAAQMSRMEQELASLASAQEDEGIGDDDDFLKDPDRPVVVLHEGRWHRGWTMPNEGDVTQDAVVRVHLIDIGRVLLKEIHHLRNWNAGFATAKSLKETQLPPLAMPFYMKGVC